MNGGKAGVEFAIDPAKFHDAFAADLPERADGADGSNAATRGRPCVRRADAGRRPGSTCPRGPWSPRGDKAAGADVIRAEAERAGAKITEVEGSHVIMISQPETVTDVILEALASVGSETMAGTTA